MSVRCDLEAHFDILLTSHLVGLTVDGGQPMFIDDDKSVCEGRIATLERAAEKYEPIKLLGTSNEEYSDIHQWIAYALTTVEPAISSGNAPKVGKFLNDALKHKVYAVGNTLTLADLVLYATCHKLVAQMPAKRRLEFNNFIKWFDLVQGDARIKDFEQLPFIDSSVEAQVASLSVENKPKTKPKAEKKQKKSRNESKE